MEDRRAGERFDAGMSVLLYWQVGGTEVTARGVAENVGNGGAALAIKMADMPPVGAEVRVRVAKPAGGEVPNLKARVVRHTSTGLAVNFI